MITKPMKAATWKEGVTLVLPVLVTDKYDGIRCLKIKGEAVTSKFKLIPNDFIRGWIEANCPDGFDGEIMVPGRTFHELSGDVRRREGAPDFRYHVFDYVTDDLKKPYLQRVRDLAALLPGNLDKRVIKVLPQMIRTLEELWIYEQEALARGREGVMIRSPSSPYKCGRSTIKEGYLIKIKRFVDDEATVWGWEEENENTNPAEKDAFGRTKRSHHKAGMVPKGTLGKLLCRTKAGVSFEIGTGFTAAMRKEFWDNKEKLVGLLVKFKYQPVGVKEKPRCPVFLGFRDKWDL